MDQPTESLRQRIINHIMTIKLKDEIYARSALREYVILLPWLDLNEGVRDAMKAKQ